MYYKAVILFFLFLISAFGDFLEDKIQSILPDFENYIQKSYKEWETPGICVTVVHNGEVVFIKTFGVSSKNTKQPFSVDTVVPIASSSKPFLATLIMRLVEEGKIHLDDPVRKYMPDFTIGDNEVVSKQFTIRDLLSHRSGLPSFSVDSLWFTGSSQKEIIKALSKIPLKKTFREFYGYQNHVFALLGPIAEKITGKAIKALYKEYFFDPLNMKSTSASYPFEKKSIWEKLYTGIFGEKENDQQPMAAPHHTVNSEITQTNLAQELYVFPGCTGINASISDMTQWLLFLLDDYRIKGNFFISPKLQKELSTPHSKVLSRTSDLFPKERFLEVHYGLGWFLEKYGIGENFLELRSHMGGSFGYRSLITIVPKQNIGIVVLSNAGGMRESILPEAIRNYFLDRLLNFPSIDWSERFYNNKLKQIRNMNEEIERIRTMFPAPHKELKKYVGIYCNELYAPLKIQLKDGILLASYRNKSFPLTHLNGEHFQHESHKLSDAYSGNDLNFIIFGKRKGKMCLESTLLNEGEDSIFYKE
ncbi:MAG: serine hydrolase domain-containing protein [Alphaproteobacteria bacterium]